MTEYVMIVVYAPQAHTDAILRAMCDAGAGTVDDGCYDRVAYVSQATCHYRVLPGAVADTGETGREHRTVESRIEAICRYDRVDAVVEAVCAAHPYQTPAIAIYPTLTGEFRYWQDAR
jgi:hypothetical protein